MKRTPITQQSFEEVATTAVRLGRELTQLAHQAHAGGSSSNVDFVSRTLRPISQRAPFNQRDDGGLIEIRRIIEADLETETVGSETRFVEVGYDADGPVTAAREFVIYTERGEELLEVLRLLADFMAARSETLDRAAAEREIRRLTSG